MEDPDTESEQSDQSSDGDESFADSLTEDVTRIRSEDLARKENNLPAHSNGNYVEEKLETWNNYDAGYGDLPLDLRTHRGQEQGEAVTGEEVLEGRVRGGGAETKLATPPHLLTSPGSEKADFETMGEKIIESPQPFVSSSSFDSDSTKSFRDEGSPMSTKSSPKEAGSEESDGEQDAVSESLLQDLIISAMPTSSQDSLAPTPRPVWDTDNSNQTVLHEDTQALRHSSANVSYDSHTSDDSGLQQCEELLEEDEMVTYTVENSPLKQWRVSAGTAATVDNNTNIINNNNNNDINRGTPRKEATFVLGGAGDKINDAGDEAAQSCVKMRKSQSEQQLRAGEAEARRSDHRRSWTKSPRTSRLIPGVVIKELKLKPRSECKTPVKPAAENSDPVVDIKTEVPEVKQEVNEVPYVKVNILDKDVKMTSSVISNYDDTISKIEEPSAMVDICSLMSVTEDGSKPRPSLELDCLSLKSISHQLDSILPPSLLDEVTLASNTLIADQVVPAAAPPAATYLLEDEANTADDVTDVFEEESTLTPRGGEEEELGLVPDLPLDSEHTTPTRSSSRATPPTVRRIRSQEREEDATSHLTYVISNNTETSGYRSVSTDIIDVDARLTELMGEMYSWQVAEEELMEQEACQVRNQMFTNILSIFTNIFQSLQIFSRVYKYS